jgi:hypothetical protein
MPKQYASKAESFNLGVYDDRYKVVRNRDGDNERILDRAGLVVEFRPLIQHGTFYARVLASKQFFPQTGWRFGSTEDTSGHALMGAIPSQHPQPTYDSSFRIDGMTEAYDPTMHFGYFDTAWISDDERRAEAEKALDEHGLKGIEYIEITAAALVPPWPTYDAIGQGATMKIPATVKDLGIDPTHVMEYEAATKNRTGVLEALAKLIEVETEAAEDEASLSRTL